MANDDRTVAKLNSNDVAALAAAIYGEARNQGPLGKAAVAYTAVTRSEMAGVPVSDVVYGSASPKYGQYSFANPQDPNARTVASAPDNDPEGWADAVETAKGVLSGTIENPIPGATNYKTKAVNPGWADVYDKVGTLGDHEFYAGPEREIAGVVQKSAYSPYRRDDLVGEDQIGGGLGMAPGTYEDMPDVEGNPTTISKGEFDFTGPKSERGFGRMTPETQHVASEMARTLPDDQRLTMTATHGEHGLSNLTHTPGAAFDARIRDKTPEQLNAMVDSALYSRPAAIGYNSGAGAFPAHMHVDTNAGYGTGLQSTSDLSGLSDYAKQELERYDSEMKSGLGYTPPVPESIAPVPEARPVSVNPALAQNAIDAAPYRAETGLSGGISDLVDRTNPNISSDGVPINRVQSVSIRPGDTIGAPQQPSSIASALSSISPVGNAYAGTPASASANLGTEIASPGNISASGGTLGNGLTPSAMAYSSAPLGASGFGALSQDLPSFSRAPVEKPVEVASIADVGLSPAANATAKISLPTPSALPTEIARNPFDLTPALSAPVSTLPDVIPETPKTVVRRPAPVPVTERFPDAPSKPAKQEIAKASDVWSGNAAEGVATDGSKLSRNPDGSISRYSEKSGKTEKVGDSISGWKGPSIGDTTQNTGGFWSSAASNSGTLGGNPSRSFGDVVSDFFGGGKGPPTPSVDVGATNGGRSTGGGLGFGGWFRDLFSGTTTPKTTTNQNTGTNTGGGRSQYETAKDPTSVGLY